MTEPRIPGYPDDLRSPSIRVRSAAGPFGDFEARAARVVARATGLHVVIQDDNRRPQTPDFRVEKDNRILGTGEVVTTTDGKRADQLSAFGRGDLEFDVPALNGTWWVTVTPSASRKGLEERLTEAFAALEERGEHRILGSLPPPPDVPDEIAGLAACGLTDVVCDPRPRVGSGKIYGLPQGIGGPTDIDWEVCADWVDAFLDSDLCAQKIAKLERASAEGMERHLYVGITGDDPWPLHQILRDCPSYVDLPSPPLPSGLTHIWLDDAEFPGRSVVAWWPDHGWLDVTNHWKTA